MDHRLRSGTCTHLCYYVKHHCASRSLFTSPCPIPKTYPKKCGKKIDSGGFSEISSPEPSSDDYSDHVEVVEEDVNVIRGAELYRIEPLARPRRVVEQDARDDDQPVQPAGNNDRLTQRSYAI